MAEFLHTHYIPSTSDMQFRHTLTEFLDLRYRVANMKSVMSLSVDGYHECFCVPDEFRAIFRAIIHFLVDLHYDNFTTAGLLSENHMGIIGPDDMMKIKIPIISNPTQEQIEADFVAARNIIVRIIRGGMTLMMRQDVHFLSRELPDVHDFLQLLELKQYHPILIHHLGILSLSERSDFIIKAHNTIKAIVDPLFTILMLGMNINTVWVPRSIPAPLRRLDSFGPLCPKRKDTRAIWSWKLLVLIRNFSVHAFDLDFRYGTLWVDAFLMKHFGHNQLNLQLSLHNNGVDVDYSILTNPC